MNLSLGFSTCPNDTFMFHAMIKGLVDTEGLSFDVFMGDVEELNKKLPQTELDITKASFFAFATHTQQYKLLNSGSALGFGNGPLLISKHRIYPDELGDARIAIPGEHTTANLLLTVLFPQAKNKQVYLFSDIEEAVLSNEVDAGLIIHENRFTYKERGLKKIADLGEEWERARNKPIPLGGILIRRTIAEDIQLKVDRILRRSITFAFENPEASRKFVKGYARELKDEVIENHIRLYVNEFSVSLGDVGKDAVQVLFDAATQHGLVKEMNDDIFVKL
ncbi:MAG: 1,4-dihydroxy-6-naphthoate synthase [Bacteroidota bacterium]